MSTLHLVSCVGTKRSHACAAKDLYCSRWFKLVRTIVEQRGEPWWILSAKYNLLLPDAVVRPYNVTLADKSREERMQWAEVIYDVLPGVAPKNARYVIWGDENSYEFLAPMLSAELPLQGLGIGQQLSYLRKLATKPRPAAAVQPDERCSLTLRHSLGAGPDGLRGTRRAVDRTADGGKALKSARRWVPDHPRQVIDRYRVKHESK